MTGPPFPSSASALSPCSPTARSLPANIETTAEIVQMALQSGYRHIDTAQSYGTEQGVGRAIAASGIPRDQLYITSKLANNNHEPDDVRRSFDQTLEYLGVEQLDLFLIHWPLPTLYDGDYVSTWRAVTEFVAEGRLRSAGVSNFQPGHLERIIAETGEVPTVNQFELHPYFANSSAQIASRRHGIAVEAHSPLGHNAGPADRRDDNPDRQQRRAGPTRRSSFAGTCSTVTSPSPSRFEPERMNENINVFDFELSDEEIASIDALDKGEGGRVGPNPDTYEGV